MQSLKSHNPLLCGEGTRTHNDQHARVNLAAVHDDDAAAAGALSRS